MLICERCVKCTGCTPQLIIYTCYDFMTIPIKGIFLSLSICKLITALAFMDFNSRLGNNQLLL